MIDADRIEAVFNRLFRDDCGTVLAGGAEEPLYVPPTGTRPACIRFREDFVASALHEVAHWCIAGRRRRRQRDYGYWYEPERDDAAQRWFEFVEARPQALEWILSVAAGVPFRVSCDNFSRSAQSDESVDAFRAAVRAAAHDLIAAGLPKRAERFAAALSRVASDGSANYCSAVHYRALPPR